MSQVKEVIVQGLWKNNSALVQLLGMCPLLAAGTDSDQPLHLRPAPLDPVGNPYSDLRYDHCVGGQYRPDAD